LLIYRKVRWRTISKQGLRINGGIQASVVRLIDDSNNQVGIIDREEALAMAREAGLDLVEVAPTSDPPVCRLMDYGKFKYQQRKKAHQAKKKQAVVHVKEVKFRPRIDEHDLQFKLKHIERFLKDGHKTKVTVVFRGRELRHRDIGEGVIARVSEGVKEWGTIEQEPKFEGRTMVMLLSPRSTQRSGQ